MFDICQLRNANGPSRLRAALAGASPRNRFRIAPGHVLDVLETCHRCWLAPGSISRPAVRQARFGAAAKLRYKYATSATL